MLNVPADAYLLMNANSKFGRNETVHEAYGVTHQAITTGKTTGLLFGRIRLTGQQE